MPEIIQVKGDANLTKAMSDQSEGYTRNEGRYYAHNYFYYTFITTLKKVTQITHTHKHPHMHAHTHACTHTHTHPEHIKHNI